MSVRAARKGDTCHANRLFVGDTLLVSRIRGVGSYEILDTASIPTSG